MLPPLALVGVLPSALLCEPLAWALQRPETALSIAVPEPSVGWILATNLLLAAGLWVSRFA